MHMLTLDLNSDGSWNGSRVSSLLLLMNAMVGFRKRRPDGCFADFLQWFSPNDLVEVTGPGDGQEDCHYKARLRSSRVLPIGVHTT